MQMLFAQKGIATDSWDDVKKNRTGEITILWCDIEPFIYLNKDSITGVEYELMQAFPAFLKETYHVDVHINWQKVPRFEDIYPVIKSSRQKGLFALSYFSITEERKKEVKFSPPYMPDLNIIVTANEFPVYEKPEDLLMDLKRMKGYTMGNTTMKDDMSRLQQYMPGLPLLTVADDYEVMRQIAKSDDGIGYVPLSIYIVGLQKGIKIKRQKVLPVSREGFAAIYTKESDWDEPVNTYFKSETCKTLIEKLIRKHLGAEVSAIILEASAPDSLRGVSSDIELLTKEREIVTERLINTALQVERERIFRNIIIAAVLVSFVVILVLLKRFTTKKRHAQLLQQRNDLIVKQKNEIELINLKLQQKLVFAQLNPHLIFNSLTAVQHFVMLDDKKSANKYLTKLSKFIRHILQNAEQPMVLVEQEKSMIEQFLELEQARFEFKFDYQVEVEGNVAAEYIPSMLVFPFVEHALYEGVLKSKMLKEKGMLTVHFDYSENTIVIIIRDNSGMDYKFDSADESTHIAEEQIALLNKSLARKIIINTRAAAVDGSFREMRIAIPDHITL
jgi:hypothetical protein